ncbi:lactonase family protein [Bdellovibrio sp. BCCA]|uniref:lactonase family protein n=1 Tax=Bdellovibrio sp. BCCA TaxID=3136281 RepID=UPI0030F2E908
MKHLLFLLSLLSLLGCGSSSHHVPLPKKAQFAYILNSGDDTISQYKVSLSGELIPLATGTVATGAFPASMVMDGNQKYLYVANSNDDTISQFVIGSDGALTALGSPVATGSTPQGLSVSSDGRFLYAMNLSGESITQYAIGTGGELSLVATKSHAEGPMNLTFSPSGKFAYVVNGDTSISQFSVALNGTLAPLTPATMASSGCPSGPLGATQTVAGEFIYVLSCFTEEVEVFFIGANGGLTSQEIVKTGLSPQGMIVAGKNLYVANSGEGTLSMFAIQTNGKLAALAQPTVSASYAPETLAADDVSAYVIDFMDGKVQQYTVNANGELTVSAHSAVATGANPIRILLKY